MGYYASNYYESGYHSNKYYQGLSITRAYNISMGERLIIDFEYKEIGFCFEGRAPLIINPFSVVEIDSIRHIDMGGGAEVKLSLSSDFTLLSQGDIMINNNYTAKLVDMQSQRYEISKAAEVKDNKEVVFNG